MNVRDALQVVVALLLAVAVLGPAALLTQHIWNPFDRVHRVTAEVENGVVVVAYDLEVFRRYPVHFYQRIVHERTGLNVFAKDFPAGNTAKLGRFPLTVRLPMPLSAPSGDYCLYVQAKLQVNVLNTHMKRYAPVCFTYRP